MTHFRRLIGLLLAAGALGCTPAITPFAAPVEQRQAVSQQWVIEWAGEYHGPLDADLPEMCTVGRSPQVIASPRGDVAIIWQRFLDRDRIECINPEDIGDINKPTRYRIIGTDRVIEGYPEFDDLLPEAWTACSVVISRGAAEPSAMIGDTDASGWKGEAFWHDGKLCTYRRIVGERWEIVELGGDPIQRIGLPDQGQYSGSWISPPIVVDGETHFFMKSRYWRKGEPPSCFGGNQSQITWYRREGATPSSPDRKIQDGYRGNQYPGYCQFIPMPGGGCGALLVDDGMTPLFERLSPYPSRTMFWQEGLPDSPGPVKPLVELKANTTDQLLIRSDGLPLYVWAQELSSKCAGGDHGQACRDNRIVGIGFTERGADGQWTGPKELVRGAGWAYGGFAAAAGVDNTALLIMRSKAGTLAYIVRSPEGVWSDLVETDWPIGSSSQLRHVGDGEFILVSRMEGNLYWARLRLTRSDVGVASD